MQHSANQPSDSATAVAYEQSWAALLLAWVAAFSDAIGFLVLQQLGASFMSGNSMATGVALGRLDWASVLQRGVPILAFFLGNMLGNGVSALPLPSSLAWKRCACLLFCCLAPTRCKVVSFVPPPRGYFICVSCC